MKEKCDWWEGLVNTRGVWRSTTMVLGALCVLIGAGICRMPWWCVVNWAMAQLWVHLGGLLLEVEVVQFGTAMCAAVAVKPTSHSVAIMVLVCITVATVKM